VISRIHFGALAPVVDTRPHKQGNMQLRNAWCRFRKSLGSHVVIHYKHWSFRSCMFTCPPTVVNSPPLLNESPTDLDNVIIIWWNLVIARDNWAIARTTWPGLKCWWVVSNNNYQKAWATFWPRNPRIKDVHTGKKRSLHVKTNLKRQIRPKWVELSTPTLATFTLKALRGSYRMTMLPN
jgi:hypothetical protein